MKKNDRMDAWLAAWDQEPSSYLPAEYRAFFFCFNRGEYYEAHDVLEHLWLQCRDANRLFFQGLIQFAGAFVHLQKHHLFPGHPTHSRRLSPARRLFALAATNLEGYGPVHLALNLPHLLAVGAQWSALAAGGKSPLAVQPPPMLSLDSP
jgi:predicted metal-dependent hydrolase